MRDPGWLSVCLARFRVLNSSYDVEHVEVRVLRIVPNRKVHEGHDQRARVRLGSLRAVPEHAALRRVVPSAQNAIVAEADHHLASERLTAASVVRGVEIRWLAVGFSSAQAYVSHVPALLAGRVERDAAAAFGWRRNGREAGRRAEGRDLEAREVFRHGGGFKGGCVFGGGHASYAISSEEYCGRSLHRFNDLFI